MSNTPLTLSERPKIKYSPREKKVFDAIKSNGSGKISTREIAEKTFQDQDIFHMKATVISALASLRRKVEFNREPFVLKVSGHAGPNPMWVWLEERK
jgi:hypothetical protein